MCAFNHPLLKPSYLYGNLPYLPLMSRKKPPDWTSSDDIGGYYTKSEGTVTGGKMLAGVAEYTDDFCNELYRLWKRAAVFKLP